jgi:hypothetical protein
MSSIEPREEVLAAYDRLPAADQRWFDERRVAAQLARNARCRKVRLERVERRNGALHWFITAQRLPTATMRRGFPVGRSARWASRVLQFQQLPGHIKHGGLALRPASRGTQTTQAPRPPIPDPGISPFRRNAT